MSEISYAGCLSVDHLHVDCREVLLKHVVVLLSVVLDAHTFSKGLLH